MKWFKYVLLAFVLLLISGGYVYTQQLDWLRANMSHQHRVPQDDLSGNYDVSDEKAVWWGDIAYSEEVFESDALADSRILGTTSSNKRIEIDLTNQRLYAFEGDNKVFDFVISSGLYGWTPTGTFETWIKLKYAKMEGGSQALGTYYYLPNVPSIMYFANDEVPRWKGFGIHGAYWHNDFGRPKSHGCVNLRPEDAEQLFYWSPPGTEDKNSVWTTADNPGIKITIYGKYAG